MPPSSEVSWHLGCEHRVEVIGELASVRDTGDEASNVQTVALAGLVSAQRSQALTALTLKDISVSGEWNEILCVKTVKKISTRKELNTNHGTKEHVEW